MTQRDRAFTKSSSTELDKWGEWYHSFESLGVHVAQRQGEFPVNQRCKEGTILAYLRLAIEKSKRHSDDGVTVLELFCADGYYSAHARRMGARHVTGVDLDSTAIAQARAMSLFLFGDLGDFLVEDVHCFYPSAPYDVVLCCGGLYHVPDPKKLLARCYEAFSRKFLVVQSVVTLENDDKGFFVSPAPGWEHGCRFSRAWLRDALVDTGWRVVDSHFNELEGNPRPCDRGSAYFLCEKEHRRATGRLTRLSCSEEPTASGRAGITLCAEPNIHAPPARLEWHGETALVHGYQNFVMTNGGLTPLPGNPLHLRKAELLRPHLAPRLLKRRTVLDLGANAGFFSFWALQQGADRATAVEMDRDYTNIIKQLKDRFHLGDLRVVEGNVTECNVVSDVVLALGLVHWVYSCTAAFGSLDVLVAWLAERTNYVLIVEWVDPEDPAIAFFHHIDWNREIAKEPYTRAAFEAALRRHFARVEHIGDVAPTRRLYAAYRTRYEVDLSGPLPLLMEKDRVIACRRLTSWNGVDYWSCVYDCGDVIQKQATLDLAEREAYFLRQLTAPYFPRVLDVKSEGEYSVVTLEKIPGVSLREQMHVDIASSAEFHTFVQHCLNLLRELRGRAIVHRDIRLDNILLHEGRPILIDFGWAVSPERPCCTPPGLGADERPPDGSFCDVYSMGRVLAQVSGGRFPEFDCVISLMTQPDPALRVTDIGLLKTLFGTVAKCLGLAGR